MGNQKRSSQQNHAFVVRIWWENGLSQPDGSPLWRGQIQHAGSGRALGFHSLEELLLFIQDHAGSLVGDGNAYGSIDFRESNKEVEK
jgi:hypothetical protein